MWGSIVVVALATGVRLAWVLLVPTRPVGDFAMYVESAAHLVEHRALDPEFVYMPGYVLLLALVKAAGGGLLAAKLIAVALGGLTAGAVHGIGRALWSRAAGLAAGLLYALWPAGIAVCSVTGTDLPATAIIAFAGLCLVRWGPTRPLLAAALFGTLMGAAAWIRAVAMPLAALAGFYFWVQGAGWRAVLRNGAVAVLAAIIVLAPWAVRNRLRYGETFFTDSHGGLTALVGANPNSEGRYSRSLNRMFEEVTGHPLLAEPHREADRQAYALARQFTRFEPAYAVGLVVAKAERLLANERALLYWPVYRAGVLPDQQRAWFANWRGTLEVLTDAFWFVLVIAAGAGLVLSAARRHWLGLTFVPLQLGLIAIYSTFFAETRYQLPIAVLLFPPAGAALACLREVAMGTGTSPASTSGRMRFARPIACALISAILLFVVWPGVRRFGARLRERHRWAAHVCRVEDHPRICQWRRAPPGPGDSPVLGIWDGVGLSIEPGAAAETVLVLPPGRYRVSADLDVAPTNVVPPPGDATLSASGAPRFSVALLALDQQSRAGETEQASFELTHAGGRLPLRLAVTVDSARATRLWLSNLRIEAVREAP